MQTIPVPSYTSGQPKESLIHVIVHIISSYAANTRIHLILKQQFARSGYKYGLHVKFRFTWNGPVALLSARASPPLLEPENNQIVTRSYRAAQPSPNCASFLRD